VLFCAIDLATVTAERPYYQPPAEMDFDDARCRLRQHPMLLLGVARHASGKVRPGGTLLFMAAKQQRAALGPRARLASGVVRRATLAGRGMGVLRSG
jgi:hypothetical protein